LQEKKIKLLLAIRVMIQTCNNIVMWTSLQAREDGFIDFLLKVIHNITFGRRSAYTYKQFRQKLIYNIVNN